MRFTSHLTLPTVVVAAAAAFVPLQSAHAALVNLCGPMVCYEYDNDAMNNPGINSFGAPTLLGGSDVLEFTPTTFGLISTGGSVETLSAVFQFTRVYTTNGGEITSLSVTDSGDYRILNGGSVSDSLRLTSTDLNDDSGLPGFPESVTDLQVFSTAAPTPGFSFVNWSLTSSIDPAAAFNDVADVVNLQIHNVLDAVTYAAGQQAIIAKKLVLTTGVAVVPIPAAAWLFGSALGLLGWGVRRHAA